MIVVDTSAAVEFLVGKDEVAENVRDSMIAERLAAPHAVDLECASTLRGLVLGGKLPPDEGQRALELLGRLAMRRYSHIPLLPRIWQLRDNMWPHDAAYVALAESLDADLLTVDDKIQKVPGIRCGIRNPREQVR